MEDGGSGEVQFFTADFPVVVVKFPHRPQSEANLDKLIGDVTALLAREERFSLFVDTRMQVIWNAKQRRRMADWFTEEQERAGRLCVGIVIHTNSEIVRGALTAMLWLVRLPYPIKVVTRVEPGVQAMLEMFTAEGATPERLGDEIVRAIKAKLKLDVQESPRAAGGM